MTMTRHLPARAPRAALAAAAMAAALLAGCDGDGMPTTKELERVKVTDLSTGRYTVTVTDADALSGIGHYYAADDGQRWLVIDDADAQAQRVYRRATTTSTWVAVPADTAASAVTFSLSQAATSSTTYAVADVAGHYRTVSSASVQADFTIDTAGKITAGTTTCQLTGQLATSALPAALKLTLATSGCSGLPASATGVLLVDSNDAPAAFRLVADDGSNTLVDLKAYAE